MALKVETLQHNFLYISLLSFFLIEWPSLCSAQNSTNTIKAGQALSYSAKLLVSADGRFLLGFFNVSYSSNGFLGIRYASDKDSDHMVWVANRDTPITGVNATLTMDSDGLLKITQGDGGDSIPLNSNRTGQNSTATLENNGNLVVRGLSSNGSLNQVLWESFDYPTDTLLPGMKLGANLVTGKKWILTSWLSDDNPGTGAFTLEYDHTAKSSDDVFVVKRRGNLFLTGGLDIGDWGVDDYSFVSNKEEVYFNFSGGRVGNLALTVEPDGRVTHATTNGSTTRFNSCSGGLTFPFECAEKETPQCRATKDVFERRSGWFLYNESSSSQYFDHNSSIGLSDCYAQCIRNCSCVGFNTLNLDGTGCTFWSEGARFDITDFEFGDDFFLLNSTYPFPGDKSGSGCSGSGKRLWIWLMITAVALMV